MKINSFVLNTILPERERNTDRKRVKQKPLSLERVERTKYKPNNLHGSK